MGSASRARTITILGGIKMTMINGKGVSIVPDNWEQEEAEGMVKNDEYQKYQSKPITVGIKLFNGGKIPTKQTSGAACFDCYANEDVVIASKTRKLVKLGFGLEMPYCYEALIRPRSGLSKKGIDIALGTIDEDFKAEISANVINNTDEDFEVHKGDRICQIAIRSFEKIEFVQVEELSETERGSGGFGHTGLK